MEMRYVVSYSFACTRRPILIVFFQFYIVARGSGSLSLDDADGITYNTSNPVRRDTLVIPADSYAVLRFENDNPGVWVM